MGFKVVDASVLKIFKEPIVTGFADHYYLAETKSLRNSVGWGTDGLELRGEVRITLQELERLEKFVSIARYNIEINNCEHFANYVLHGINFSSQENIRWKCLGAEVISLFQPVQCSRDNYGSFIGQQIAEVLSKKLERARHENIDQD